MAYHNSFVSIATFKTCSLRLKWLYAINIPGYIIHVQCLMDNYLAESSVHSHTLKVLSFIEYTE